MFIFGHFALHSCTHSLRSFRRCICSYIVFIFYVLCASAVLEMQRTLYSQSHWEMVNHPPNRHNHSRHSNILALQYSFNIVCGSYAKFVSFTLSAIAQHFKLITFMSDLLIKTLRIMSMSRACNMVAAQHRTSKIESDRLN